LKKAYIENGKVVAKNKSELISAPTVICVNETSIIVGDDESNLTMFDQRTLKKVFEQTGIHDDCITSVIAMEHKSKYQFLTSGSTTVALVDVRKGVIVKSDDQEDEILSGCLASEQTSMFGMSEGVVTLWKNDQLQDQRNRIRLSEESIDCLISSEFDHKVYAGGADGCVRLVNSRSGKIESQWRHSTEEEVMMLELDHEYKLVSAGMESLCLWSNEEGAGKDSEDDESEEEEENKDNDISHSDSDEQEKAQSKKRKKNKNNKKNPPTKKHIHGISSFEGL
jgi:WD40 repeat protein